MDKLRLISDSSLKAEAPELNIGSTVRVHVKIREGIKMCRICKGRGLISRLGSDISHVVVNNITGGGVNHRSLIAFVKCSIFNIAFKERDL